MDGVFYKQLLKLAYYSQFPEIEMRGATIFSPFVVETVDSNDIVLSVDKHRYGELKYALRQIA